MARWRAAHRFLAEGVPVLPNSKYLQLATPRPWSRSLVPCYRAGLVVTARRTRRRRSARAPAADPNQRRRPRPPFVAVLSNACELAVLHMSQRSCWAVSPVTAALNPGQNQEVVVAMTNIDPNVIAALDAAVRVHGQHHRKHNQLRHGPGAQVFTPPIAGWWRPLTSGTLRVVVLSSLIGRWEVGWGHVAGITLPRTLLLVGPPLITGAVIVALAMGVAAANLAITRRITSRHVPAAPFDGDDHRGGTRPPEAALDALLGTTFFVLAGCAFVVLCFLDGFSALTAHGVDVQRSDAAAARTLLIVGWTWWPGLVLAVSGLISWIALTAHRRPLAFWASIDLTLMIALDIIAVTAGGS